MDDWAAKDSRITLCAFPWENPVRTNLWWISWLNYARQHAKSEHVMFLDADEILHEDSYGDVRRAAEFGNAIFCHRWNFWKDAQHLIPEGECCGVKVLKCGPRDYWYPSDYPDPQGRDEAVVKMAVESNVKIGHYGFLRKREAFFKKAKVVQGIWAGDYDPRLEAADKAGGNWMEHEGVTPWKDNLTEFTGTHPKVIHKWLVSRGYTL